MRPRSPSSPPINAVGSGHAAASAGLRAWRTRRAGHRSRPFWRRPRNWDDRAGHLEQLANTPAFLSLRQEIIKLARLAPNKRALDIGAGTGLLTLAAAPTVRHMTALDISPAMCGYLEAKLASLRIANVDVLAGNATDLPLPDGSLDVVLSNYCLHHLNDVDKRRALAEVKRVLRPGGGLVIGDMMFRIGLRNARDRGLVVHFSRTMLRRGPAGVLRLLHNVIRLLTGRGEHPASVDWWHSALEDAGFKDVAVWALDHEGGIAVARRAG